MLYFLSILILLGIIVLYVSLTIDKKEDIQVSFDDKDIKSELTDLNIKNETILNIKKTVSKYIVGTDNLVNSVIVAMLANDHILVEGVPGLAKTKTILVFSKIFGLDFKRIQFTPDMLPSDIIGGEIYNKNTGKFEIFKGPIFTNLLLADEINRATPKVQSALLEAMQERRVTIGNTTFNLDRPFFVMATQNPIEQEGTFTLPEAQLDRFLFKVVVSYPSMDDEMKILDKFDENIEGLSSLLSKEEIILLQSEIADISVGDKVKKYIVSIVNSTREKDENILVGASTRAVIALKKASMVVAYLQGKSEVEIEDVKKVILLVLRHRVKLSYKAMSNNLDVDSLIISKVVKIEDF